MKTLDKYLIKSFLVPFFASFSIVMFVLIMQALWLVFDDIAGKGIEVIIILKFLWYMCMFVTPQALPISVLLSSIMTLGNLGENYEFAAVKSAGISFFRFLRPLIICVGLISVANFFLINYTYPYASLKQKNLLLNIKKTQPTLALVEGSFNDEIPGYSIKFSKKYGEENNLLKDVLIIETKGSKDDQITITAKKGKITTEEGSKYMTLILDDGYYFEDHTNDQKRLANKLKMPSSIAKFDRHTVNIDISDLTSNDLEEEKYKHHYTMKNMGQLKASSDSLKYNYDKFIDTKVRSMQSNILVSEMSKKLDTTKYKPLQKNILDNFTDGGKINILNQASSTVDNKIKSIDGYKDFYKRRRKNLNNHDYQFHYILTNSFSCLLLFFVGSSLGSIIRKGGFGMPMIIAIIIYVAYYFINTFGKNVAEESKISAFLGGWSGTLVMLPLAILFTISASKDMGFIKFDVILTPFKKLFNRFKKTDE
ncbi:LptF/LptG family permease [Wenyingzhuangia marina]|uniref:LptF/LptG family permease n=1 Tax=Wenyingzhuangia marina TaxID=1195760 RepID=UPI000933CD94|nr:LptF/LptG family permease [Wenyingzhuangia marina]